VPLFIHEMEVGLMDEEEDEDGYEDDDLFDNDRAPTLLVSVNSGSSH
jgi:hypothetical protein